MLCLQHLLPTDKKFLTENGTSQGNKINIKKPIETIQKRL